LNKKGFFYFPFVMQVLSG